MIDNASIAVFICRSFFTNKLSKASNTGLYFGRAALIIVITTVLFLISFTSGGEYFKFSDTAIRHCFRNRHFDEIILTEMAKLPLLVLCRLTYKLSILFINGMRIMLNIPF